MHLHASSALWNVNVTCKCLIEVSAPWPLPQAFPPFSCRKGGAGCLESVDWTTGLEYWDGLNCCKKPFSWYDSFLESGYPLSHFPNVLHALFRHPASKSWGLKVTCIFNKLFSKAGFWHPVSINFCAFCKALVITQMYLCLTVSMAGCLCLFSGSSKWNVHRPRNTLLVIKLCKYTSTYLQHVDGWKRPAFLKIA